MEREEGIEKSGDDKRERGEGREEEAGNLMVSVG